MKRFALFELVLAFRFMREGLMQTALIILGVGLGGGVITFMSILLSGLQSNVVRRTLNYQASIVISPPEQVARALMAPPATAVAAHVQPRSQQLRSIDQWQKIRDEVVAMPGVLAVSPVAAGPGFAKRGDADRSVSITGIEPATYYQVIGLDEKMVAGHPGLGPLDIIIGTELASDLGAGIGDKLRLASASEASSVMTVKGIFDFGNKAINERNVYIALRSAQSLLDLAGGASSLQIKVSDPFEAEIIAQRMQAAFDVQVESWIKTNSQFFTAMAAQILTNTLIRLFVGLTVALGIASVLVVSVVQKAREIGILRAMGTSRRQILRIFLIQGAAMGLAGSLLGSMLAGAFLMIWRTVAKNPDGTPMFIVEAQPLLFIIATITATAVGMVAAIAPARRAARLDPAVAIRG